MRTILLFCLIASTALWATEQQPDLIVLNNETLNLDTGWGHPSPLEIYFFENKISSPFQIASTANYRGYIATWAIKDTKLYLKEIAIPKVHPETYEFYNEPSPVFEKIGEASKRNEKGWILADWFSGAIMAYSGGESSDRNYFHIRRGKVINEGKDIERVYSKYVSYFFNLRDEDIVIGEGESHLESRTHRLSPLFQFFSDDHLMWPYNWENENEVGTPRAAWAVKDDILFITELEIHSGFSFYKENKRTVPLEEIFPELVQDDSVKASWVNGVFAIYHGETKVETPKWMDGEHNEFVVKEIEFIKVRNGEIIASQRADKKVLRTEITKVEEADLRKLLEEYRFKEMK